MELFRVLLTERIPAPIVWWLETIPTKVLRVRELHAPNTGSVLFVASRRDTGCDFFVSQNNCTDCTTTGDYLYVANGNNTYIAGFGVSTTGALSVLTNSPYNNGVAAQSLAITPNQSFLYVATTDGIFCYLINSDGSITVQNSGSAVARMWWPRPCRWTAPETTCLQPELGLRGGPSDWHLPDQYLHWPVDRAHRFSSRSLYRQRHHRDGGDSNGNADHAQQLVRLRLAPVAGRAGADARHRRRSQHRHHTDLSAPLSTSSTPADYGLASDPTSTFLFVAEYNTGLRVFSIGTNGSSVKFPVRPTPPGQDRQGSRLDPREATFTLPTRAATTSALSPSLWPRVSWP